MVLSNQLVPGTTIVLDEMLFRVETCVKVTVPKGIPFIKTKLRSLESNEIIEKSFKLNLQLKDVALVDRQLEFLYLEGRDYLFLEIDNLEQILVPEAIIADKSSYLKEGVEVKAALYGTTIFSIELPQFLELMVSAIEDSARESENGGTKMATLETGAKIEVPSFIEVGDIIKVDTKTDEYIQRM